MTRECHTDIKVAATRSAILVGDLKLLIFAFLCIALHLSEFTSSYTNKGIMAELGAYQAPDIVDPSSVASGNRRKHICTTSCLDIY